MVNGSDFISRDSAVNGCGGVHVIQAFLSADAAEEYQVMGRTGRQDQRGSYQQILWKQELTEAFGVAPDEFYRDMSGSARKEYIAEQRDKLVAKRLGAVEEELQAQAPAYNATKAVASTHQQRCFCGCTEAPRRNQFVSAEVWVAFAGFCEIGTEVA